MYNFILPVKHLSLQQVSAMHSVWCIYQNRCEQHTYVHVWSELKLSTSQASAIAIATAISIFSSRLKLQKYILLEMSKWMRSRRDRGISNHLVRCMVASIIASPHFGCIVALSFICTAQLNNNNGMGKNTHTHKIIVVRNLFAFYHMCVSW